MNVKRNIGIFIAVIITTISTVSIFWTPYPVLETNANCALTPPSLAHIAGTDNLGRDIFSRLMAGGRYTLITALITVTIASTAGSILGGIAGYNGGVTDYIIMRLTDAVSSFPSLLLALVIVSTLGGKRGALILALAIVFTPSYIRLSRVASLSLRGREYIIRERGMGAPSIRILLYHILPNALSTIFPAVIVGLSNAILSECAMCFLGLGSSPPIPSWGQMMSDAGQCILTSPWYAFSTGIVITLSVVAFNCIGMSRQ